MRGGVCVCVCEGGGDKRIASYTVHTQLATDSSKQLV